MTWLAWVGTLLQIAGALALAGRILRPGACYAIMGPGAALLLAVAIVRHDAPQAFLMTVFLTINGWGAWKWR